MISATCTDGSANLSIINECGVSVLSRPLSLLHSTLPLSSPLSLLKPLLFSAGFNPMWEETLVFTVHMPELALVRFLVWDHDPIGQDFIGQRTIAFNSMMPGKAVDDVSVLKSLEVLTRRERIR